MKIRKNDLEMFENDGGRCEGFLEIFIALNSVVLIAICWIINLDVDIKVRDRNE